MPRRLPPWPPREDLTIHSPGTGGSGEETLLETAPLLLPGEILAEPAEGLCITAAGYADGYFHIQLCRGNAAQTDNHARLWLEDPAGNKLEAAASVGFLSQGERRTDYTEFLFDVAPGDLSRYTLTGDFDTASDLTEGFWQGHLSIDADTRVKNHLKKCPEVFSGRLPFFGKVV